MNKYHINKILSTKLLSSTDEAIEKWEYEKYLFQMGSKNVGMPPIMPLIWKFISEHGKIPSVKYIMGMILEINNRAPKRSSSHVIIHWNDYVKARSYQCRTAILREIDVMIYINNFDKTLNIFKYLEDDLKNGIDFSIQKEKDIYQFQISHEGKTSNFYNHKRKNCKTDQNIIILTAPISNSSKLDLVPKTELEEILSSIGLLK